MPGGVTANRLYNNAIEASSNPFFIFLRYFIYGMQDEQNLERVMLEFEKFNIPETTHDSCGDGYLKV